MIVLTIIKISFYLKKKHSAFSEFGIYWNVFLYLKKKKETFSARKVLNKLFQTHITVIS